jgi:hypothetical protein
MEFINRIFVGKYLAVLCLKEIKLLCQGTELFKVVFNYYQHNYLLAFYQIKLQGYMFRPKFLHLHYIQMKLQFIKKIQQDATMYQNSLFLIYMKLNMFRGAHRPSLGA